MRQVTKLQVTGRGRLRVTLDGEQELDLPRAAGEHHHLRVGLLLTDAEAAALLEVAARDQALRRALHFLSFRPRSRAELERFLERKGYQSAVVEETLAACAASGQLDDADFARAFVRDRVRLRPRGAARLEAELRQRGVDGDTASAAVLEILAEEETTERDLLGTLARQRWAHLADLEPLVARRRLEAFLRRRGFPADEIARTVRELMDESGRTVREEGRTLH